MKPLQAILAAIIGFLLSWPVDVLADDMDSYRLATEDEISVTVFNEDNLNLNKVRISDNGTISMPLIGQIVVSNLTVAEVEKKIMGLLLQGYLKKPNLMVTITEYRPFYISGEVRNPGGYPFRQGLTVKKAVTLAGGFTERAAKSAISLVNESTQSDIRKVMLDDDVKPGDVITIGESFF